MILLRMKHQRWEYSVNVSRRVCVSLRVTRLKPIRYCWLDVWTLRQSWRISSEALRPETNTSTLLGAEQTRSLQQAGRQYTICWLGNRFDRPKKKKAKHIYTAVTGRSQQLFPFSDVYNMEAANVDVHRDTNYRPPHAKLSPGLHRSSQKSSDVPRVSFHAPGSSAPPDYDGFGVTALL